MNKINKAPKIKRFLDCYVPVTTCNFRCPYCYITQQKEFDKALPVFKRTPEEIAQALSNKRLGGSCVINLCGGGETLLPPMMTEIIKALLKEDHYVMVVTNGSVSNRFDELAELPKELLSNLFVKFSFHYLELIRLNLLDTFFNNVNKMRNAGASITLEITPHDELIPHIDDIKNVSMKNVGALPHITVARSYLKKGLPILTNLSREEYQKVWGTFDSALFDYKLSIFGVKRKEFCYAGDWITSLDINEGTILACYSWPAFSNIYDNIDQPISFEAIGCNCVEEHCFNGHAFLGFGAIPGLESPYFEALRNRVDINGKEWLQPEMKQMFSSKLIESNKEYSLLKKAKVCLKYTENPFLKNLRQAYKKIKS